MLDLRGIPEERIGPMCSFGCSELAFARVALSRGCAAYPQARKQDLCFHHFMRSEPIGSLVVEAVYTRLARG